MKKSLFYALALLAFFSACQDNSSSVLDLQNEISSSADGPSIPRKLEFPSSSSRTPVVYDEDPKLACSDSTRIFGEITDVRDGHVYKTVKIGDQVWMAENLEYNHERYTGDSKYYYSWVDAVGGIAAGCSGERPVLYNEQYIYKNHFVYDGVTFQNCPIARPARGLCPDGWRIPTTDDFLTLLDYAGGPKYAGKYLKSTTGWSGVGNGLDCFGFNASPSYSKDYATGLHEDLHILADEPKSLYMSYENAYVYFSSATPYEAQGYVVRCIQGDGNYGLDIPIDRVERTYTGPFDSLTDTRDGHVYKTVGIGGWVWMAENLSYGSKDTYTYEEMINAPVTGCYLDSLIWGDDYGMWNYCPAELPIQGICPDGWHVPSSYEWRVLSAFVNGLSNATNFVEGSFTGPMLKSTSGWPDGKNGLDAYGFGAKPTEGKDEVRFWSSTNAATRWDWFGNIILKIGVDSAWLETDEIRGSSKASVRCLKDDESQKQTFSSNTGFSIKPDKPTTYSGEYGEFTDERDGNVYRTVDIDGTVWFADNLKYEVPDALSFCNCADTTSCDSRGRLYPWEVAKNACPAGWHLPSVEEANHLLTLVAQTIYDLGGFEYAENFLKDTVGWKYKDGYNTFGFSAIPAGMMYYHFDSLSVIDEESCNYPKVYDSVGITNGAYAYYWVDGLNEKGEQAYIGVGESGGAKSINWYPVPSKKIKNYFPAYSVRCVKD
ncbi:MAG: hypothetical protein IKS97_03760 [Fibrobacter sp.]|nr:hypothetical protein [Fibrobacter sp.]